LTTIVKNVPKSIVCLVLDLSKHSSLNWIVFSVEVLRPTVAIEFYSTIQSEIKVAISHSIRQKSLVRRVSYEMESVLRRVLCEFIDELTKTSFEKHALVLILRLALLSALGLPHRD